jgi:hypothetical protein
VSRPPQFLISILLPSFLLCLQRLPPSSRFWVRLQTPARRAVSILTTRLRRQKNTNSPSQEPSHRPQSLTTDKVEGTVRSEKNEQFDGHQPQQQTRGAMAGTQRYIRYIVFALVVRSSPQSLHLNAIDPYRLLSSSSSYRPLPPLPTGLLRLRILGATPPCPALNRLRARSNCSPRPQPLRTMRTSCHLLPMLGNV